MKTGIISTLAIFIGLGAITMSCEKEQFTPGKENKVKTTNEHAKDGGDDDDDPVIRGKVKKSSGLAVDSALVETIIYGSNIKAGTTYSNSSGDFGQTVPVGIYYLKVTNPNSGIPVYTDTIHVNSNVQVTVIAN